MTSELDEIFTVLQTGTRRQLLLLLRSDGVVTEADLVAHLDGDRDTVKTQLEHIDLPKLDDAGFIVWERDTGTIRRGPRFGEVKPVLDVCEAYAEELPGDWPR